ncbi:hypothetical protein C7S18_11460 [Ahniella affigens]|uniref:HTH araC/xylS-type domain-containing protein n=1 Tax=Ahniella affigens TaxID=2021234 RepID=A0A2P1PSF1_9GAMM|nr:AraC family transcriptional regulator [Ahniella affigens]AVP97776.1 hypothetical protein C7S18_11460 [Ahniella affigens]
MDLLTDLLQQAGLRRRPLNLRALAPGMALRFPCPKSLGLHALLRGQVYVHAPDLGEPIRMQAGDALVMARGVTHTLSLDAKPPDPETETAVCSVLDSPEHAFDPNADTQLLSGAYQFWNEPLHPFLRDLPAWSVIRKDSLTALSPLPLTLGLLDRELRAPALGVAAVTNGLMDALFSFALRELSERLGQSQSGWHAAVRDAPIRTVLARMHEDPAHAWTLEELARAAGLSRTVLAERFRTALGDTPLNHLRTLRMQRAMHLLSTTEHALERIAGLVGYQDAFGFSKVFKRCTGMAPRQFREQDRQSQQDPWRFQSAVTA